MSTTNSPPVPVARVLLVMNSPALCETVSQALRPYDIQCTASYAEVESLREQPWDLAICHYVPLKTAEFIETVQGIHPQMPVIVLAEQITIRETAALMRFGARDVLEFTELERLSELVQIELSAPSRESTSYARFEDTDSPEQQMREILDAMHDAVLSMSLPDRRIIYVSASFERVFGYPVQEFLNDPNFYKRVIHPDDYESAMKARASGNDGGFVELDHRIILPDGQVRWLHRRAWVIFDAQGHPVQVIDTARDITARKRTEEELRAANHKQRAILNTIPDLMFHIRADGTILDYHYHASFSKMMLPPELFIGKNAYELFNFPQVPTDILQQALEKVQQALELRQPTVFEYTMPDQRHYEARIMPIEESDEIIIMSRNITDRKQREAELRASEEKYRSLLESSDSVVAMFDENGTVLYANEVAARPFGLTPEQMVDKTYHELFPPEVAETQLANMRSVIKSGQGMVREASSIVAGEERWYRTSIQPVRSSAGIVTAVLVNATDITERKRAEKALKVSEEQLHLFIEHAPVALAMFDHEMRYLAASQRWIADYRLPQTGIIGQSHYEVFPNEIPARWRDAHQRGLRGEVQVVEEDEFRRLDGSVQWLRWALHPWYSDDGAVGGIIIFAEDITERKQREVELRESNDWRRLTLEASGLGAWRHDLRTQQIYLDERARSHYGIDVESVPMRLVFERIHREDVARVTAESAAALLPNASEHSVIEYRTVHPDGAIHWLVVRMLVYFEQVNGTPQAVMIFGTTQDITERKQAEEALRRSEAYLRSLVNSEAAFNIRVDMQGKISYCNDRYRHQFAWAAPSVIGMLSLEVVHPADILKVHAAVKECLVDPNRPVRLEIRKRTESGDYMWTLWEFSAVLASDGSVMEIHCVGFDITKQKEAEAALQEANRLLEQRIQARTAELQEERNLLRTVIDAIPDYIYVKDRQHRMKLNNAAHIQSVGAGNGAEMIGKTDLELYPQALAAKFHADEDRLFESERAIVNLEEHAVRADQSDAWFLTTKVPLRNVQGEIVGLVGITRDITDIRVATEALRISEERYSATVASMSEGIVVQNVDGSIQLCNAAAERILGLTKLQMIGRTSIDPRWLAVHEDGSPFPGETHPAMVTLRTGEPQSNVIMGIHKPDGSLTWILINAQPLIDPVTGQRYAVVTTFADITAAKLAEAALKEALTQEKELGELKSRFVSMASHEFRTPLASILAASETLTSYWERLDKAKIDDRLSRIRQQVGHMTEIIEDTLQLTRLQTGRAKYEPASGDLDALCTDVITEFADLPEHDGRIIYECAQYPVPAIYDDRLMRQAITNLLQNALKYSASDETVRVTLEHVDGQITLRVIDQGIGIPPEDLKRLFEPFHRAANVTAISGTGLGLSITKQAIELHGGAISVESQLGIGTTFTVLLPGQPE